MNIPTIKFANGLITFLNDAGYGSIDHLKLQKLIHIIHYLYVKRFNVNNLIDEMPEKWVSGYIYRSVYNTYSKYSNHITPTINTDFNYYDIMNDSNISDDVKELISDVIMMYINKNTFNLILISNTLNVSEILKD